MPSTTDSNQLPNALKNEKSAYLQQHANNPVFWMPYTPEALQKAKDNNLPILISVGYSSCHWCHVMNEESFEDQQTANFLNENFVAIKVDREEMPDLDQYLQMICQLMNGRGGWPLNVFLTPDIKPFYAGTYFPKFGSQDNPSFLDVLRGLSQAWRQDRDTIMANAKQLMEAAKAPAKAKEKVEYPGHFPSAAAILNAVKKLADEPHGGYGKAPKFPQFPFYEFAIEQILEGMIPEELGRHIVLSLEKMLMGGVYDHARGGVHRYSVDESWLVPHFEKMLYDQAGLLRTLAKLALIYPSPLVIDAQIQTLNYIRNEMLAESNYFFASQDADSEGVEGFYFTFTKDEFADVAAKDEEIADKLDEVLSWFRLSEQGNFEQGLNVVALDPSKKEVFLRPENWALVRRLRSALLEERKNRIPPMTDNKGVASWNFMLVSALVDTVQYSKIQNVQELASEILKKCVEGVHKTFLRQGEDGQRSSIKTSTTRDVPSSLFEDFTAFAHAQLRLYEISGNETFKTNGLETLLHIQDAFWSENAFYTRALAEQTTAHDNIPAPVFDQSYQAPVGTYLLLLRKWSLESPQLAQALSDISASLEELKSVSLTNPLGFGELLRSFVYPDEAFKKIKMPLKWLRENKIQSLLPSFSSRFALVYHDQEDGWEICGHKECEKQGKTFEEFAQVFRPKKQEKEERPEKN